MINIFEEIKSRLSVKEVYERYTGNKVNRAGKAICAFHQDKNPSMSFHPKNQFCKCFVCDAGGDAIEIVEKLFNLTPIESARKLDEDYHLGLMAEKLDPIAKALVKRAERERKERQVAAEKLKAEQNAEYIRLCEETRRLEAEYNKLVPQMVIFTGDKLPWEDDRIFIPLPDDFIGSPESERAFDIAMQIFKNENKINELLEVL